MLKKLCETIFLTSKHQESHTALHHLMPPQLTLQRLLCKENRVENSENNTLKKILTHAFVSLF